MSRVVETAHYKFVHGSWTSRDIKAHLKVNRLDTIVIKNVIENAWKVKIYQEVMERKEDDPTSYEVLLIQKKQNPSSFKCWKSPSYWSRPSKL